MKEMEVRCCCRPEKLLGWLPVPNDHGKQVTFWLSHSDDQPVSQLTLQVDQFNDFRVRLRYPALKAEGIEIETLRRIPRFRENPNP